MRRAKLAPGSLPPGSLPTTSWYKIPRCFVCDETIKSHRLSTSLLAGRTQYSHSPLPTKIGGYIGDQFVVVVTAQDALCKHCMALINTMDRLEQELRQHQNTLLQHLKTKYRLGNEENADEQSSCAEVVKMENNQDRIKEADEEWRPNKKLRTDVTKHHRCAVCNASFTNLCLFMAHLSRHRSQEKLEQDSAKCSEPMKASPTLLTRTSNLRSSSPNCHVSNSNSTENSSSVYKCGCCAESFIRKDELADHMQVHTSKSNKASSIHSKTNMQMLKPAVSTFATNQESSVSSVQASALFEDLDQLPQPEVPIPAGTCTEEQKGRVCLLALLNNGACSDLTHREPAASVLVSVNDSSQESDPEGQPAVTVTVSVTNDLNYLESSYSSSQTAAVNLNSEERPNDVIPSCNTSKLKPPVDTQPEKNRCFTKNSTETSLDSNLIISSHSGCSFSVPDLGSNSLSSALSEQVIASVVSNSATQSKSDWKDSCVKASCEKSSTKSRIQDMPDLLVDDEVKLSSGLTEGRNFQSSTNFNSSVVTEMLPMFQSRSESQLHECSDKVSSSECKKALKTTTFEPNQQFSEQFITEKHDPINNVAIVSVMSKVNFDTHSSTSEWSCSKAKVLPNDYEGGTGNTNQSWLQECKHTAFDNSNHSDTGKEGFGTTTDDNGTNLADGLSEQ